MKQNTHKLKVGTSRRSWLRVPLRTRLAARWLPSQDSPNTAEPSASGALFSSHPQCGILKVRPCHQHRSGLLKPFCKSPTRGHTASRCVTTASAAHPLNIHGPLRMCQVWKRVAECPLQGHDATVWGTSTACVGTPTPALVVYASLLDSESPWT